LRAKFGGFTLSNQCGVNITDETLTLGTILEDNGRRSLVLPFSIDIMESAFLREWSEAKYSRIPGNSRVSGE
jgi:hypothetical protein